MDHQGFLIKFYLKNLCKIFEIKVSFYVRRPKDPRQPDTTKPSWCAPRRSPTSVNADKNSLYFRPLAQ